MNIKITKLLWNLEFGEESAKEEALLHIALTLERQFINTRDEKLYDLILPSDLRNLEMQVGEKNELVNLLGDYLFKDTISFDKRLSLLGALAKICQITTLERILVFAVKWADKVESEELQRIIVAITPTFYSLQERQAVNVLLMKYNVKSLLRDVVKNHKGEVVESIDRLIKSIDKILVSSAPRTP
jgi:hypothetical protein